MQWTQAEEKELDAPLRHIYALSKKDVPFRWSHVPTAKAVECKAQLVQKATVFRFNVDDDPATGTLQCVLCGLHSFELAEAIALLLTESTPTPRVCFFACRAGELPTAFDLQLPHHKSTLLKTVHVTATATEEPEIGVNSKEWASTLLLLFEEVKPKIVRKAKHRDKHQPRIGDSITMVINYVNELVSRTVSSILGNSKLAQSANMAVNAVSCSIQKEKQK